MPDPIRLLITAGPTHEPIDAVRYIANRSSGRMGIAIAAEACDRGYQTTLLLGPTHLQPPDSSHLTTVRFQTTADLQRLLADHWPRHDTLIMAAAVADYRPKNWLNDVVKKIRRTGDSLRLDLEPTPDLLGELAATTRPNQIVIGFALEPEDELNASALEKLSRKRLDGIVANPLETMDAETVTATLFLRNGERLEAPANSSKAAFATWLLSAIERAIESRRARENV